VQPAEHDERQLVPLGREQAVVARELDQRLERLVPSPCSATVAASLIALSPGAIETLSTIR